MKYIVNTEVLYKEQVYIEAENPEKAILLALEGKGLRMGQREKIKVLKVEEIRETSIEI